MLGRVRPERGARGDSFTRTKVRRGPVEESAPFHPCPPAVRNLESKTATPPGEVHECLCEAALQSYDARMNVALTMIHRMAPGPRDSGPGAAAENA